MMESEDETTLAPEAAMKATRRRGRRSKRKTTQRRRRRRRRGYGSASAAAAQGTSGRCAHAASDRRRRRPSQRRQEHAVQPLGARQHRDRRRPPGRHARPALRRRGSSGREYVLVDTGGFDPESDDPMQEGIARQVRLALDEADVVSVRARRQHGAAARRSRGGEAAAPRRRSPCSSWPTSATRTKRSRRGHSPLRARHRAASIPVSALHGHGIGDLEEALVAALPPPKPSEEDRLRRCAAHRDHRPAERGQVVARQSLARRRAPARRQPPRHHRRQHRHAARDAKASATCLIDTAGIRRKRARRKASSRWPSCRRSAPWSAATS